MPPIISKSSPVPPAYFLASPVLLNKKGTLGSGPTFPLSNQFLYFLNILLFFKIKLSKNSLLLTWADKLLVPSKILDIGFFALPNNFWIIGLATPLNSDKLASAPLVPVRNITLLWVTSSATEFNINLGRFLKRTWPWPFPNKKPLGIEAPFHTSWTISSASSSERTIFFFVLGSIFLATTSWKSLIASLIKFLVGFKFWAVVHWLPLFLKTSYPLSNTSLIYLGRTSSNFSSPSGLNRLPIEVNNSPHLPLIVLNLFNKISISLGSALYLFFKSFLNAATFWGFIWPMSTLYNCFFVLNSLVVPALPVFLSTLNSSTAPNIGLILFSLL